MVLRRALIDCISSQKFRRACGSSPVVGSIQEQHRRVVDQRDREQQPLLLAAGELAGIAPGELLERAQADDLIDLESAGVQSAEQRDALAHR